MGKRVERLGFELLVVGSAGSSEVLGFVGGLVFVEGLVMVKGAGRTGREVVKSVFVLATGSFPGVLRDVKRDVREGLPSGGASEV